MKGAEDRGRRVISADALFLLFVFLISNDYCEAICGLISPSFLRDIALCVCALLSHNASAMHKHKGQCPTLAGGD
jgi:hypothetical protein